MQTTARSLAPLLLLALALALGWLVGWLLSLAGRVGRRRLRRYLCLCFASPSPESVTAAAAAPAYLATALGKPTWFQPTLHQPNPCLLVEASQPASHSIRSWAAASARCP